MAIVRVKTKYQVTLPTVVREQAGIYVGDVLEAKVEKGKITLTPKSIIDRELARSLDDYKKGRSYGPFNNADEMIASLKANLRKRKKSR